VVFGSSDAFTDISVFHKVADEVKTRAK